MRPIPKSLLIHTVIYAREAGANRWEEASLTDQQELRYVRMEPSEKMARDKNHAEVQLSAVFIYDCKNSLPQNMKFAVDDVILFNGQKHKVQSVEALYDEKGLHHYELELIKHA